MMRRRDWMAGAAALGTVAGAGWRPGPARAAGLDKARVVVVGGGIGGTTAAKYLRLWSGGRVDVTLVEPQADFVSCPLSNLVLGGFRGLDELRQPLDTLRRHHGVRLVRDSARAIDPARRLVTLAGGDSLRYDRLVLSPGIELDWASVEGLRAAHAAGRVLQAWKAGPETLALRRQLQALPEGGVVAITVPEAPYRCPPGPYERACVIADYLKRHKPRAKLLLLDANPEVTSKGALFRKVWAERYAGLLEYRPSHKAVAVAGDQIRFEVQEPEGADVLNVLPAMGAGAIARDTGLTGNSRWVGVDYRTFAATRAPEIHVIGDAIQAAPAMPKSGHMANAHAKVAAAAILAGLADLPPDPAPMLTNTCYSHVDEHEVIHVASVHRYVEAERTYRTVPGSGGVSDAPSELEARYAWHWARTLWSDMLA